MASEQESSPTFDEEGEGYGRPRPRRRFRSLHWRHSSQSHSSPLPSNQPTPEHSPPQMRPVSVNVAQSRFGEFHRASPSNTITSIPINLESPTTSYSYRRSLTVADG
jgi:hypothetical protein